MGVKEKLKNVGKGIRGVGTRIKSAAESGIKKTKEASGHKEREIKALNAFYESFANSARHFSELFKLNKNNDGTFDITSFLDAIWNKAILNSEFHRYVKSNSPTHKHSTLREWYKYAKKEIPKIGNNESCSKEEFKEFINDWDKKFENIKNILNPFEKVLAERGYYKISKHSSLFECTTQSGGCAEAWKKVNDILDKFRDDAKITVSSWQEFFKNPRSQSDDQVQE